MQTMSNETSGDVFRLAVLSGIPTDVISVESEEYQSQRQDWVKWLEGYGLAKFYDAFIQSAQDAESVCQHCGQEIYLDIAEGGGVPDWRTIDGDYGCDSSTDTNNEGTGGHLPRRITASRFHG